MIRLLFLVQFVVRTVSEKKGEVNAHLEEICAEKDIVIITHCNMNPKRHLNKSRLHLNDAGISVLVTNFKTFLRNLD